MTLIVGNVVDVGLAGLDGTLRVWAWFRPEEVGLIAPYRREWEITAGEIEAGVDVIPGPAAVEIDCGPNAYTTVDVVVPDAESVAIQDLFEQVYSYTPGVVSEAWEARLGAESAAADAESSAGEAAASAGRALTSEGAAALHAATLSARIEQPGQDILYTSDGKPYFADPAQIQNVPLTVDTSVGTRVFLGGVMLHGDTGWVSYTVDGMTAGQIVMRRVNHTVFVQMQGCKFSNAATTTNLPRISVIGWRPAHRVRAVWVNSEFGSVGDTINISESGYFNLYRVSPDTEVWASFSYASQPGWPGSLVGPPL